VTTGKPRLGISACLLGQNVRYDGGHKLDRYLRDTLGPFVTWVPVCPEVECGLPVPRESMRLAGDPRAPRLVTTKTGRDLTDQMTAWARTRLDALEREGLCGFVFKSKSPSSGMERVRVYDPNGVPKKTGVGLFARAFMARFPTLPVEEEGRLFDPAMRENFIERIFVMQRFRETFGGRFSRGALVEFHTRHKLLVMAHSNEHYRALGKLVAGASGQEPRALKERYLATLMEGLRHRATPKKNANVLMHILGFFKRELTADEKQEALERIDQHRLGLLPLIVPITLLAHYVRKYHQPYLREQVFLDPHPLELMLRNHV
jgi:uncharacterized protein YbgA (DUF1722 family)/uncharacterized protein YbbK (DUF523 family)